jgi:PPOX class probable F420-dependent enzyme
MEIAKVNTPGEDKPFKIGDRRDATSLDELPASHLPLLTGPITVALGTIGEDGRQQVSPMWVNHEGRYVNINSARGRTKDLNMRARPDVALLFLNPENSLHWMSINGRIVEIIEEDDPARGHEVVKNLDDLAECYIGKRPYPRPRPNTDVRVVYKVLPDEVLTFGHPDQGLPQIK